MDQFLQLTTSALGKLVLYGGGAIVIAYEVFKHLGRKWLDGHFDKRFQRLKAEQDAYLKQVQSLIDREFHRAKRLYDGEFDSLLKAWNLCCLAYGAAARLQWEHIEYSLGGLTDEEVRDLLGNRLHLPSADVDAVMAKKGVDARSRLANLLREQLVGERARAALVEFANFRASNSIFWNPEIANSFRKLDVLIEAAVREYFNYCIGEPMAKRRFDDIKLLLSEGPNLKDPLEIKLRERLWSADGMAAFEPLN